MRMGRFFSRVLLVLLSFTMAGAVVLGVDVYAHGRTQNLSGVNIWGYRGPVVGRKQRNEIRIVVVGGSTAFGYGLPSDESFSYYLERQLNDRPAGGRKFSVVNLGAPMDGAYSMKFTLQDYRWLNYDAAILYEGYNDLGLGGAPFPVRGSPNYHVWRHETAVYRLTGYFPIFPLVLREKALSLAFNGDLSATHTTDAIRFTPDLAKSGTAVALKTAADIATRLEEQLGRLTPDAAAAEVSSVGCSDRWKQYCGSIFDAVSFALTNGKKVLVVTQPYVSDRHVDQQNALRSMLQERFSSEKQVGYVNLGQLLDMLDRRLAFDGLHLTAAANRRVAEALVGGVQQLLPE